MVQKKSPMQNLFIAMISLLSCCSDSCGRVVVYCVLRRIRGHITNKSTSINPYISFLEFIIAGTDLCSGRRIVNVCRYSSTVKLFNAVKKKLLKPGPFKITPQSQSCSSGSLRVYHSHGGQRHEYKSPTREDFRFTCFHFY